MLLKLPNSMTIETVIFDRFRLDGGSMFGAVPKTMWHKIIDCDEKNRIPLVSRSLVVTSEKRKLLVDVGCGDKWSEKLSAIYAIEALPLEPQGFRKEEITDVILTHMHFDHAGGISHMSESGECVLTYPSANVFLQKANYENAKHPNIREAASYLPENVLPLKDAKLTFTEGSQEIYPNIWVHRADGHTHGLQWLEIRSEKETVVYPSDLMPTSRHVPLPYLMGYDIAAETALKEKQSFLEQAVQKNWLVVFEHDPDVEAGRIGCDERGRYFLREGVGKL